MSINRLSKYSEETRNIFDGTKLSRTLQTIIDREVNEDEGQEVLKLAKELFVPIHKMLIDQPINSYLPLEAPASDHTYEVLLEFIAEEIARAMSAFLVTLPSEIVALIKKKMPELLFLDLGKTTLGSRTSGRERQELANDTRLKSQVKIKRATLISLIKKYEEDPQENMAYIALELKRIISTFIHEIGHEIEEAIDPISYDATVVANMAFQEGNRRAYDEDPGEIFCRILSRVLRERLASLPDVAWIEFRNLADEVDAEVIPNIQGFYREILPHGID